MYAASAHTPGTTISPTRSQSTTEDIRQLISEINGFKAYYLLKLAEGTTTISVFEDEAGRKSPIGLPPRGWPRTSET